MAAFDKKCSLGFSDLQVESTLEGKVHGTEVGPPPVECEVLGAEVGRHVGLHEVQLHVGPHHEVESHHLEEGTTKYCFLDPP